MQFITHYTERYSYLDAARMALEGGCRWVQLRMKDTPVETIEPVALEVQALCRQYGATFIIDDHVELARKLHADGVHLGKKDMPIADARRILGAEYIIGGTANTFEDVLQHYKAGADYIVACIGENSYCETPGNLTNLFLSQNQLDLVKALAKTGKPIILVLNEGRPRLIADIEPLAKAVVNTMLPGNYGGDALANLIAGDANFSGKMPFTYPKEINSLITYDYKPCEHIGKQMEGAYNYDAQVSVQWAFGYGLSYTTFAYSNLKVDKSDFTADDVLTFTVDVKNTGNRIGKESVLLFSSDLVASLTPDTRRLRAFEKVELKPGETKTVTLKLKGSDLAFVGYDGKWILEKGDFRIQTGDQTVNVVCTDTKKWETPNK